MARLPGMLHACAISIALAAGCTEYVQLAPDPLGNLVSLQVRPLDAEVTIRDLSQPPETVTYHAIGTFSDGSRRDVTTLLTWTVDNPAPGTFLDPGTYTTTNAAAGHVVVTATADGVVETASVTVLIDAVIIDSVYPPSDPGLFASENPVDNTDPMRSPQLLYPTDSTMFPQGVASTLFQFDRGTGNDAFRLSFDTDVLHLEVLTGTDRWDGGLAIQNILSQTSVGEPITVGIRGASVFDVGTVVYSGSNIELKFSRDLPDGFIYFWSASTNGIMRGALDATGAGKLYPTTGTCAGCHTTTRDGTAMAMGYGGEKLQTIDVAALTTTIDVTQNIDMGWAAYSPDNTLLLVASNGQLTLYDAKTGAPFGSPTGKVTLPLGHYATHPDWAPDGSYVTVAYTTLLPTNMDVKGASIARLKFNTTTFGPPEILVAATGVENFYFPKYSPDGKYIAYVHATSGSHGAVSAELQMIGANGGIPIQLYRASHRSGRDPDLANIADTMPTWAPVQGERAWLAFASARPYGAVMPTAGRGQIWVSSIDLAHAAPNMDPSTAAFWLPCQDVTVLNNNPIWAPSANPTQ